MPFHDERGHPRKWLKIEENERRHKHEANGGIDEGAEEGAVWQRKSDYPK